MHYELHEYLKIAKISEEYPFPLEKLSAVDLVSRKMMRKIDFSQYQPHKHLFGTYLATSDDYVE